MEVRPPLSWHTHALTCRPIRLASAQECPDDAGILVGECHRRGVGATPRLDRIDPSAPRIGFLLRVAHHRARAVNQQCPNISVPALTDPEQALPPAGGMLLRHQTQPGGKLATVLEGASIPDRRHNRGGRERSDAFDFFDAPAALVLPEQLVDLLVVCLDARIEFPYPIVEVGQQGAVCGASNRSPRPPESPASAPATDSRPWPGQSRTPPITRGSGSPGRCGT